MDERYDTYCAVDPLFYDSLTNTSARTAQFPAAHRPLPDGWRREPSDDWMVLGRDGDVLPQQGWKVHVAACPENAERVLDRVWDYCLSRGLPFKFLRGPRMLFMRNSKYANRGASGKFITVYPPREEDFEGICADLAELLAGEPGPYILSDLRYGDGPVYVRYGAFAARYCVDDDGQVVPALADDAGRLVPDRRDPVFHVPSWVRLPDFLAPHLAARSAASTGDLPYRIEKVIHFSNGGGLYVGRDLRTDTEVVLKEARPHAGLDATGADAVTRLRREADVLRRLADVPQVPRVHDEFTLGEHRFLALEFIAGQSLNKVLVERYPLTDADATPERMAAYVEWASDVHDQVARAIEAIHAHGIVYGDLHLFNIMYRPDGSIALVDFEVAAPIGEATRPGLRNQGFAAPRERTGPAVDRYALACLRLALFLPLTQLLRLAPAKARHLATIVADRFPVPAGFLDDAIAEIVGDRPAGAAPPASATADPPPDLALAVTELDWPAIRRDLAGAVLASATPDRDDRLYPGDIEQFRSGALGLAHGAAGVLYALSATGVGRFPEHEEWLVKRALHPESGTRCGGYDGLAGVAYALEHLGRRQDALDVADIVLRQPWQQLGPDLVSGLAGLALALADLGASTGEPALTDAARRAVDLVRQRLAGPDPDATVSGGKHPYAGLARGHSGPALMFVRMYELTGEDALLERAAEALRRDLLRCVVRPDGAMEVNEGWRTMPYLADGGVGIGLVLDHYLRHRPDEEFARAAAAIRRCARSPLYVQSGLFAGRAGIIAYLAARVRAAGGSTAAPVHPDDEAELRAQIQRLAWHAVPYRGAVAFPGERLLRLSMDLATGTAGVLLALGTALHDEPVTLPLLAPMSGARPHATTGTKNSLATGEGDVNPTKERWFHHGTPRPAGP